MLSTESYNLEAAALSVAFSTFIQTPACSYTLSYSYIINGTSISPTWFTFQPSSLQFQISTSSTSDVGIYKIDVITSYTNGILSYSDTSTIILTIAKTCSTASWISSTIPDITSSVNANPILVQPFSAFKVDVTGCGSVTYQLTPTLSFVSIDGTALTISVASTSSSDIGSHAVILVGSLATNPTFTPLSVSFTITISNCVLSLIEKTATMISTATYNLQDTILSVAFSSFSQTPACGYSLTYTYQINSVISASPTWFTFQPSSLQFQISTSSPSDVGVYKIDVVASYTNGILSYSDTSTISLTIAKTCSTASWA